MIYSVKHFFYLMCIVLENINIINGRFTAVYRPLWNAQDETETLPRLQIPIQYYYVNMCHTDVCHSIESCSIIVKKIQDEDIKQGLHDIRYNFLIDGLGHVYEGTGWYARAIQHEKEFISICLFGIENHENPPKSLFDGLQSILDFGNKTRYFSRTFKPLLTLNEQNDTEKNLTSEQMWVNKFVSDLADSKDNNEYEETDRDVSKTMYSVDWSQVFPNHGNFTGWDQIVSNKRTILDKSYWSKVFTRRDEVTWARLLRQNAINQINWSQIFNNNDIDRSNFSSLFASSQTRVNSGLRYKSQ